MVADKLLSLLDKVKKTGPNKWQSRCPSCGGKSVSKLGIKECDDGRVLVHCLGGCDVQSVLSSVGLTFDDLFPPRINADFVKPVRKPWAARDVVAALRHEACVGALLLHDIASGRVLSAADKRRAGMAAERLYHLMDELAE